MASEISTIAKRKFRGKYQHCTAQGGRLKGRIPVLRWASSQPTWRPGIWNETETWPVMLSKVKVIGCLPNLEDETLKIVDVSIHRSELIK